jgi:hypothetical protein
MTGKQGFVRAGSSENFMCTRIHSLIQKAIMNRSKYLLIAWLTLAMADAVAPS